MMDDPIKPGTVFRIGESVRTVVASGKKKYWRIRFRRNGSRKSQYSDPDTFRKWAANAEVLHTAEGKTNE